MHIFHKGRHPNLELFTNFYFLRLVAFFFVDFRLPWCYHMAMVVQWNTSKERTIIVKQEAFANQLLILRSRTGLTQEEFGKRLNTSKRSISAWENGDGFPRKSFRILLATTFGYPPTTFLLDEELPDGGSEEIAQVDAQSQNLQSAIEQFSRRER